MNPSHRGFSLFLFLQLYYNAIASQEGRRVLSQVADIGDECSDEVLMELLNRGVDLLIGFRDHRSALQAAADRDHYEMIDMFSEFIVPRVNPGNDSNWLTNILLLLGLLVVGPDPPEDRWDKRGWWDVFLITRSLKRCASRIAYPVPL
jgi:hypothetical protein